MSAELKAAQRHSFYKGLLVGLMVGMAYVTGWWIYRDLQPDPLPEWISCMDGETGEECPPIKLSDEERGL